MIKCKAPYITKRTEKGIFYCRCRKCSACRLQHRLEWSLRIYLESLAYPAESCFFVTLTYADEFLPPELCKRDYVLFLKKLRKKIGTFRYFIVGEYGSRTHRPHFHVMLFNVSNIIRGNLARIIEKVWSKGFIKLDVLTPENSNYISGYCQKKLYTLKDHYFQKEFFQLSLSDRERYVMESDFTFYNPDLIRLKEFSSMSLKPGIGYQWCVEHLDELLDKPYISWRGRIYSIPSYFLQVIDRLAIPEQKAEKQIKVVAYYLEKFEKELGLTYKDVTDMYDLNHQHGESIVVFMREYLDYYLTYDEHYYDSMKQYCLDIDKKYTMFNNLYAQL